MIFNIPFENRLKIGLYTITTEDKRWIYIGSTAKFRGYRSRYNNHYIKLKENRHENIIMQRLYNKGEQLIFDIHTIYDNKTPDEIASFEGEEILRIFKESPKILMNMSFEKFKDWRLFKTSEELKQIIEKSRLTRINKTIEEKQAISEKHKETLKRFDPKFKKELIRQRIIGHKQNRQNHRNYRPINLMIQEPNKPEYKFFAENEQDFFNKTNFETSVLMKLKRIKNHIVKRRLPLTKHIFPIGTIITFLSDI